MKKQDLPIVFAIIATCVFSGFLGFMGRYLAHAQGPVTFPQMRLIVGGPAESGADRTYVIDTPEACIFLHIHSKDDSGPARESQSSYAKAHGEQCPAGIPIGTGR